jgi:hypothetical protein
MKDNSLQNIENYKKDVYTNSNNNSNNNNSIMAENHNEMDTYMKYVNVINQYLLFGIETIKNQNLEYLKYILIKGLFTISHVFKMLLLFTRNLDLTYHHCQKSYSYYIEFIGQIGDDAITYLQLNSKDAALFVYKKTIFDINQEYKKNYYETKAEEKKNKIISIFIDTYNKLIETELSHLTCEQLQLKNGTIINKIHTAMGHINDKLYKLYYSCSLPLLDECQGGHQQQQQQQEKQHAMHFDIIDNRELLYKKLTYIKQFCDIIISKKNMYIGGVVNANIENMEKPENLANVGDSDYYKDYIKIIEYFIKKIRKVGHVDVNRLEALNSLFTTKYISHDFEEKIKTCNALKFINWIFSLQNE